MEGVGVCSGSSAASIDAAWQAAAAAEARPVVGTRAASSRDTHGWMALWAIRHAAPGTPDHRRWSVDLYARLEILARAHYRRFFPRTDPAMREAAWTDLWARWCERAPGPDVRFTDEPGVVRYVQRSLANAMNSLCRKRAVRRRLVTQRPWDIELLVHASSLLTEGAQDVIERAQAEAMAEMTLAFFDDALPRLLGPLRRGRAEEVLRLVQERLAMVRGDVSFGELVTAAAAGGSKRTIENRMRQRYVRALHVVMTTIDDHIEDVIADGYDPDALRAGAARLFSDRASVRLRPPRAITG
jgi:hypothetical protein